MKRWEKRLREDLQPIADKPAEGISWKTNSKIRQGKINQNYTPKSSIVDTK